MNLVLDIRVLSHKYYFDRDVHLLLRYIETHGHKTYHRQRKWATSRPTGKVTFTKNAPAGRPYRGIRAINR